jgi:hypothetical protein
MAYLSDIACMAKFPNGSRALQKLDTEGGLKVNLPTSAFGEMITIPITPTLQHSFVQHINPEVFVITGDVTHLTTSMARIGPGGNLSSIRQAQYLTGQGVELKFNSIFTTSAGFIQYIGFGDVNDTDGLFFGYDGTDFGVLYRSFSFDVWIKQINWDDKCNGSGVSGLILNSAKGNVYRFTYGWGFASIKCWILLSNSTWALVHTIRYPNFNTQPSLQNPNMPFRAKCFGGEIRCASLFSGVQGVEDFKTGIAQSIGNLSLGVGPGLEDLLSIRVKPNVFGHVNRSSVELTFFSGASDGTNSITTYEIRANSTIVGGLWTDVSTATSTVEYNKTAVSTLGKLVQIGYIGRDSSVLVDLTSQKFSLYPGDSVSIKANPENSSSDIGVSLSWVEKA